MSEIEIESLLNEELESCDTYNKYILDTLAMLERPPSPNIDASDSHRISNQLKLPTPPLPTYSHTEGESLEKFFNNFESVIQRYNIDTYTKFIFLQNQLKNEPLTLIKSIEAHKQSYEEAKLLLTKAFASPTTQKFEAIKRLSELNLAYETDPYEFIGNMNSISESFKSLKIDVESILQYFFLNAMNDKFKSHLIHITNSNKPSLQEINERIFGNTER